jgi:mannose-6-phosphate isomerase
MRIYHLENPVQRYAWGSVDGMTETLGIPNPGGGPLAEIWMGAHPSAPSTAIVEGAKVGLDELIRRGPAEALGANVVDRLGNSLPFLFKVLSAGTPLSIQAHPSKRKAQLGFERENLGGIPVDASERNYRDPNHKPEMAVALTRFELICGFRPVAEIIENMRLVAPGEFERALERLERDPSRVELSVFFYGLISADERAHARLLAAASAGVSAALDSGKVPAGREGAFRWVLRIMDYFPGDVGAVLPLVLNHVALEPGQAAFVAPGELHAHLSGTCLEIMANSDNVIRGALTKKFVDLPELVSVLSFNPERVTPVIPSTVAPCEEAYPIFVPDFEISKISVEGSDRYRRSSRSPEILLCTSGEAQILCPGQPPLSLGRGDAAFVAADACDYELLAAAGPAPSSDATKGGDAPRGTVVFRASVPQIP